MLLIEKLLPSSSGRGVVFSLLCSFRYLCPPEPVLCGARVVPEVLGLEVPVVPEVLGLEVPVVPEVLGPEVPVVPEVLGRLPLGVPWSKMPVCPTPGRCLLSRGLVGALNVRPL